MMRPHRTGSCRSNMCMSRRTLLDALHPHLRWWNKGLVRHRELFRPDGGASMSWPDRLITFFREIASPLGVILNASGCREGWIQGEMFRHFSPGNNGFSVNCSYANSRMKHDLHCKKPTEVVAELKVYGYRGYYHKNICGQSN